MCDLDQGYDCLGQIVRAALIRSWLWLCAFYKNSAWHLVILGQSFFATRLRSRRSQDIQDKILIWRFAKTLIHYLSQNWLSGIHSNLSPSASCRHTHTHTVYKVDQLNVPFGQTLSQYNWQAQVQSPIAYGPNPKWVCQTSHTSNLWTGLSLVKLVIQANFGQGCNEMSLKYYGPYYCKRLVFIVHYEIKINK